MSTTSYAVWLAEQGESAAEETSASKRKRSTRKQARRRTVGARRTYRTRCRPSKPPKVLRARAGVVYYARGRGWKVRLYAHGEHAICCGRGRKGQAKARAILAVHSLPSENGELPEFSQLVA